MQCVEGSTFVVGDFDQVGGLALDFDFEFPSSVGVLDVEESTTLRSTSGNDVHRQVAQGTCTVGSQFDLVSIQRVIHITCDDVECSHQVSVDGTCEGVVVGRSRRLRIGNKICHRDCHTLTRGDCGRPVGSHRDKVVSQISNSLHVAEPVIFQGTLVATGKIWVSTFELTGLVVTSGSESKIVRISPVIDDVVDQILTIAVQTTVSRETVGRTVILESRICFDVGHKERTAIDNRHPLVVLVGADFFH